MPVGKENQALVSAAPPKPATRSRKPATGSGKLKAPGKGKATAASKKKAAAADEEAEDEAEEEQQQEDDDELMATPSAAEEDEEEEQHQGDATVLVAETQFEPSSSKGKTSRKTSASAASKKAPARNAGGKGKASPALEAEEEEEDFEASVAAVGGEFEDVKQTAREKKLQAQLAASKKAFTDLQASVKKLTELRSTRAEEAELRLREIADERQQAAHSTIQTYKTESDTLRAELSSAQDLSFSSPRTKALRLESLRIRELEEENGQLGARVEELEREREEERERVEREGEEREAKWEREVARRVKEVEETVGREVGELKAELETTRTELSAEVSHSKSLQQKLGSTSSSASLSSAAPSSAPPSKLQEEIDRLTSHLNLNEDLTGFAVHSVKEEEMGTAYSCMLNDAAAQTGGLNFKLTFHDNSTVSYAPNLEADRDAELMGRLPVAMRGYMRFEADRCTEWFKLLFTSVNKVK